MMTCAAPTCTPMNTGPCCMIPTRTDLENRRPQLDRGKRIGNKRGVLVSSKIRPHERNLRPWAAICERREKLDPKP